MKTLAEAVAQARADVAAMGQVLVDLELVSHGGAMRVDGRGVSSIRPWRGRKV